MLWIGAILTFLTWGAAVFVLERPGPWTHLLLLAAVALLSAAYLNRQHPQRSPPRRDRTSP